MIKKIWKNRQYLQYIFHIIYFNFHYLPIKQAIKFPILLYKPRLLKCKGKIEINNTIKTGMIRMGDFTVSLYPNSGIIYENNGGIIVFEGECTIGNASVISVGKTGKIILGDNFLATASFKITSYHYIHFKKNTRIAWDVIVMDTSFHRLKNTQNLFLGNGVKPVIIGKKNWLATKTLVLPGTKTPDYCVIGAGSILNKDFTNYPTHIILAGNPIKIKAKNIWRDVNDDNINFELN